jgi:hypothetical protein
MSDTRKLIDFAYEDSGSEFRDELYSAIHDKVTAHIDAKRAEIAQTLITQQEESVEPIREKIEVKKEYNDKTEAEHGIYHNGKKIGYVVHHKPSGTHTAYHDPQSYDEKGHADDFGQIDDFHSHHDAVNQIRHSAGVGIHEEVDEGFPGTDYKSQIPTKPGEKAGFTSKQYKTGTFYSRKPAKDEPASGLKKSDEKWHMKKERE